MHRIEVRDDKDKSKVSTAVLDIRYHEMTTCPLVDKKKRYKNLKLTVIHAIVPAVLALTKKFNCCFCCRDANPSMLSSESAEKYSDTDALRIEKIIWTLDHSLCPRTG